MTRQRKASFFIHAYFVAVPFGLSTGAALTFWHDLFGLWSIAVLMVASVEVLALTGLVLFVLRIPSPFVGLRHLLPFISIVPLGRELYVLLEHNGWVVASVVTVLTVAILVSISWQCFRTIEAQFIDANEAAREKARETVGTFTRHLAQLEEMNSIVDGFVVDRMRYHAPTITAARVKDQMAFPEPKETRIDATPKSIDAVPSVCPNCGTTLDAARWRAARRWGHCAACKGE